MSADPVTVACVLRGGGCYTSEYVYRLRDSVEQFLPGAPFVCLTNENIDCDTVSLLTSWPGWLAKLELFRPGLFEGSVLYLDLDSVITGSLEQLARAGRRGFTMLSDFNKPAKPASGMMAWDAHVGYSHIFENFTDLMVPLYQRFTPMGGDGGWIAEQLGFNPNRFQDLCPSQVLSYKKDVRRTGLTQNCRVVCFHGHPRPHEVEWRLK